MTRRTEQALADTGAAQSVDAAVVGVIVTVFRDLRSEHTGEGWSVERPSTILSTAEAVAVSSAVALTGAWFPNRAEIACATYRASSWAWCTRMTVTTPPGCSATGMWRSSAVPTRAVPETRGAHCGRRAASWRVPRGDR